MDRGIGDLTACVWTFFFIATTFAQLEDGLHPDAGDVAAQNAAGAAGAGSGSNLSDKARNLIIALSVIAGVVVIFGLTSAALYVVAKRRQWALREKLRQSARKVTDKVLTPLTPRFPRSAREPKSRPLETPKSDGHQGPRDREIPAKASSKPNDSTKMDRSRKGQTIDLERGEKLQPAKTVSDDGLSADEKEKSNNPATPPKTSWGSRLAFW